MINQYRMQMTTLESQPAGQFDKMNRNYVGSGWKMPVNEWMEIISTKLA